MKKEATSEVVVARMNIKMTVQIASLCVCDATGMPAWDPNSYIR